MDFKGITIGTYISKKPKGKKEKNVCMICEVRQKAQKQHIDKEKEYEICKECNKCYVSKTCKALITTGRDSTTGKVKRKTFIADTEEQALSQALQYKIELEKEWWNKSNYKK